MQLRSHRPFREHAAISIHIPAEQAGLFFLSSRPTLFV